MVRSVTGRCRRICALPAAPVHTTWPFWTIAAWAPGDPVCASPCSSARSMSAAVADRAGAALSNEAVRSAAISGPRMCEGDGMASVEQRTAVGFGLFNPATYSGADLDPEARRLMLATIEFFESRGKARLKHDDHEHTWYADFLEFVKRERVFATLLTPDRDAGGDP